MRFDLKSHWWFFFSLFLAAIGMISCQSIINTRSSQIDVKSDREDTQIKTVIEGKSGTVDIQSESGIGRGQFDLNSGRWPEQLVLRFHLSGLEGMQFQHGDTTISVSVRHDGTVMQNVTAADGNNQAIGQENNVWMSTRYVDSNGDPSAVPMANGVIELEMPEGLLDNSLSSFTLEWVDFYR